MANKELKVKIQEAYDTEANWIANDPVLLSGQLAFSSDKYGKYKIGDGIKTWKQLEYATLAWNEITGKPSTFNPNQHNHTISQITDIGNASVKHASTAGSATNATTATKLGAVTKGSATQPIYLNAGVPTACTYTLGKSVPSNAVFTDTNTTYSAGKMLALSGTQFSISDVCATITNWNDATTNGWYMGNGASNAPTSGSWYFGYVVAHNVNYIIQEVYQFTASVNASTIPKYIRAKMNGTWGSWTNVTVSKAVPSNAVFTDTNTWNPLKGATTSTAGTAGYAPAPSAGAANRYLRSDGIWAVPPDTNTTYGVVSTTANGLAPKRDGSTAHFLRGDGTWAAPPNTTYSVASGSTNGLMSSTDKTKLDGIATGANKYVLPTAGLNVLGGVKTTSQVTSASGYTACPIIGGVPYYKDTNTTYTLNSFGITATATELNFCDGVTSNIQTQLNGKAPSGHSHSASQITGLPTIEAITDSEIDSLRYL